MGVCGGVINVKIRNALLTLLTVLMLIGVALAVPLGTVTDAAQERYAEESNADEADFL